MVAFASGDLATRLKGDLHRVLARGVSRVLRPGALTDARTFRLLQRAGYSAQSLGFYSSIPDLDALENGDPPPSECPGIDFNPESHRHYLRDVFPSLRDEFDALARRFPLDNSSFRGIDPLVYYGLIRHHRPTTIIEIGVGNSTLLAADAVEANGHGHVIGIDPYQKIIPRSRPSITLIDRTLESLDVEMFDRLGRDDILFVDSSHVIRTGGDVHFLFSEVLPRLNDGVIVHFHDIHLPFDYPRKLMTERLVFWTEQYLLQAYLAENSRVEVLFGNRYALSALAQETRAALPTALEWSGGSFWIRRVARKTAG
jgi:hypothetical protein